MTRPDSPIRTRQWCARITPSDRWGWWVHITHGATYVGEGPHWSPTRDRAERWASRRIARGEAHQRRVTAETFEVSK